MIALLTAVNVGPQYQHYRLKFVFWILCGLAIDVRRIWRNDIIERKKINAIKEKDKNDQQRMSFYKE